MEKSKDNKMIGLYREIEMVEGFKTALLDWLAGKNRNFNGV